MLEIINQYVNNIYVLPIIATVIGLSLVYLYDFFEKKQYTNAVYFRIGLLIYISCLATIYISRLPILQIGGGNTITHDTQSFMPQPNELRQHVENFKTGVPTF